MNFIFKMLVAKYGKQIAERMYAEYKRKKSQPKAARKTQQDYWTED